MVNIGYRDRGVKEAEFYVLKHTRAPALLLEIGFTDNTKDNQLFDAKFEAIAEGIVEAILGGAGVARKEKICPTCGQKTNG